jgi:hypothetical protein
LEFELRATHPDHFAVVIFLGVEGLRNYLPGLASNCNPPYLILPSSKDYRHEPPVFRSLYQHFLLGCSAVVFCKRVINHALCICINLYIFETNNIATKRKIS